ncbi:MAG: hypothetical protein ACR2P8_01210, partial [Myxococcota bacterium]
MRQALLVLVVIALIAVVPHLLPEREREEPKKQGPTTSQRYASDGTYIAGEPPATQPHNLIVVLLDTVRRDAVGLGDEPERYMPNFRALAKRGVAFRQAATVA